MPATESVYGARMHSYERDTESPLEEEQVRAILGEHAIKFLSPQKGTPPALKARLAVTSLLNEEPQTKEEREKLSRALRRYVGNCLYDKQAQREIYEIFQKRWQRQLNKIRVPEAVLSIKTKLKELLPTFALADVGFTFQRGIKEGLETEYFMLQPEIGPMIQGQLESQKTREHCWRVIEREYQQVREN